MLQYRMQHRIPSWLKMAMLFATLALFGCANNPAANLQKSELGYRLDKPDAPSSPYANVKLRAMLIAVGNEQPVFDRFVTDFSHELKGLDFAGVATSSSSGKAGKKISTLSDLYREIHTLKPASNEGCFVYLTGHGGPSGMALPVGKQHEFVPVADLNGALTAACGERPTIVVISSCFSGVYMRTGIAAPNRIVITAADPDHTSFGCSNDQTYTYFDGCFMKSFAGAKTWQAVADGAKTCVSGLESKFSSWARPSNPQAFFGRNMRDLPLPGPRPPPSEPSTPSLITAPTS
ncbi:MAG TPA: C13 family peptidase [Rhodocyclaceae bacterium]|nr:C13 family peptidase [Rhodocyclaceae bacterium]